MCYVFGFLLLMLFIIIFFIVVCLFFDFMIWSLILFIAI